MTKRDKLSILSFGSGAVLLAVILATNNPAAKEVSTLPDRYTEECVDGVTILWYSKGGGGGAMTVKFGVDSKVIPCTALDK
jgi:hypothetical protein